MIRSWLALVLCLGAAGCKRDIAKREPAPAPAGPSLLEPTGFHNAMNALATQIGAHPQVLALYAYPDHLDVQAEDAAHADQVLQYEYRAGMVAKPVRVVLKGKGTLEDNLFPLDEVKVELLPEVVQRAVAKVDAKHGKPAYVVLKRDLPIEMDVQYRVYVKSPNKDGYVDADKNGKLVGE